MKQPSVLLAMSGGVDSSVAATILQEQGYNVYGVTLRVWSYEKTYLGKQGQKSDDSFIEDAKQLAQKIGIPHYVVDVQEEFEKIVINNFIEEYFKARTPNPCVLCNPTIKWKSVLQKADELGCEKVATGHYAHIKFENGRYYISKGLDEWKDQSYVLWNLSQEALFRTLFPVGNFNKSEIKERALQLGWKNIFEKPESYDVCFIPDGNYRYFLQLHCPDRCLPLRNGVICNSAGKWLGHHQGYPFYTIGQRKGLEVAVGHPVYVTQLDAQNNQIILGEKEDLLSTEIYVSNYNIMKYRELPDNFKALVKIRYKDPGRIAQISREGNLLKCTFSEAVSAVTPGQSAVFYEGNDLVGGGIIEKCSR